MVSSLPTKTKTDVEELIEKFDLWVDERIFDLEDMPFEYIEKWRVVQQARIDTLQFAKGNLKRLAQEVKDGNSS